MAKTAAKKHTTEQRYSTAGRPDKLTPEIQNKIVTAVRAGAFVETAASYAGISKVTLYDWMKRGNKSPHGKFRDFLNAVEQAFAEATVQTLRRFQQRRLKTGERRRIGLKSASVRCTASKFRLQQAAAGAALPSLLRLC